MMMRGDPRRTGGGGALPIAVVHRPRPQLHGLGLFDSTDFQDWSFGEWFVVIAAAFTLFSLFRGTARAAGRVRSYTKSRRSRSARRAALKRQLAEA